MLQSMGSQGIRYDFVTGQQQQRRCDVLTHLGLSDINILSDAFTHFSVQYSRSVVSNSLRPHGLQHTRLPCPSPTPGAYSNSCPSSQWPIQPSHSLSSPSPLAFNLSQHQGLFQWVSSSHQVAKGFSISPSNEHPGLISSRMDWFALLAVQGTLKSLLQHHNSRASILQHSAFIIVPILTSIHDYWKNHN